MTDEQKLIKLQQNKEQIIAGFKRVFEQAMKDGYKIGNGAIIRK